MALDCELCERSQDLTFHHLIPKTLHKNKWFKKNFTRQEMGKGIDICNDCHKAIHKFIGEKDLGRNYFTKELLMEHEKVRSFVRWIGRRTKIRLNAEHPTSI